MRAFLLFAAALMVMGASAPGAKPAASPQPVSIAQFTQGMTPTRGLFTIWRKAGKVYLQVAKSQLGTDFIQTAEPASGLGGYGVAVGLPYIQMARIMRFTRADDQVVISWPNTSFVAENNPAAQEAVEQSFAPSVVANAPIVAQDASTGDVLFDASPFLGDVMDLQNYLRLSLGTDKNPGAAYRLDPDRTYWGTTKAFPENVVLEADQTFASAQPQTQTSAVIDNVPDPRSIQIRVKYNIAQAPALGSYTPRIADNRVGYYPDILLDYGNDRVTQRQLRYILRWNIARHPMIYYISNTVPVEYRQTIRDALLTWNDAFTRLGYPHAVEVRDQPDDPNWSEDDIRYSTVHWLTQSNSGGYAQAGVVWDPRTGELVKTSIVIDAGLVNAGFLQGGYFSGPARPQGMGFQSQEAQFAAGARASMAFGVWALDAMGRYPWGTPPPGYVQSFLRYIVLHESGHNWGLQHNFIGTQAYSAKQDQSLAFTRTYGVSNSVMAYIPTNLWPEGTPNGTYFQTVLGPYDYYAIHWGYAPVAGASTPQAEVPTLQRWASKWTNPLYRYANDEDVMWGDGHAIDPRVNHWELTNDNLSWCDGQLRIGRTLLTRLGAFDVDQATHDPQRLGFALALGPFESCSSFASHYIGGEYLSRAHIGDPGSSLPLQAVSRSTARRAFVMLDRNLFSASAWQFSPQLLRSLVYTEWVTDFPQAPWQYDPPARHDVPIATIVESLQNATISRMFAPIMLQRIDDETLKYQPGTFMSLPDLFGWTHDAVYGDLCNGRIAQAGEIHRDLQQWYTRKLAQLVLAPTADTPYDAQSLARADLVRLQGEIACGQRGQGLDALTQAHLASLAAVVHQTLSANRVVPIEAPPNPGP